MPTPINRIARRPVLADVQPKINQKFNLPEDVDLYATKNGVYFIFEKGQETPVYVGLSNSDNTIGKTLFRHFQRWVDPTQYRATYGNAAKYEYEVDIYNTPEEAAEAEILEIARYNPEDNKKVESRDGNPPHGTPATRIIIDSIATKFVMAGEGDEATQGEIREFAQNYNEFDPDFANALELRIAEVQREFDEAIFEREQREAAEQAAKVEADRAREEYLRSPKGKYNNSSFDGTYNL